MISRAIRGISSLASFPVARDLALGVMAANGLAPLSLWPLALVAFALILRRIGLAPSSGEAFRAGFFIGLGWFGFGLSWITQPFFVDIARHGWMAPFALLFLAGGLALFWALAAWVSGRSRTGALGFALCLALAELARGHVLTGFPWAMPGHILSSTPLAQMVSLSGSYGLNALMLIALAAPFAFGAKRGLVCSLMITLGAGAWSAHRLGLAEPEPTGIVARIVQPDIKQGLKWDPEAAEEHFTRLLSMSAGAPADLIIWPETAVPYIMAPYSAVAASIGLAGAGRPVLTGYQRSEGEQAWNSLGIVEEDGAIRRSFDKIHLVPFGEYMPMGDFLWRHFGIAAFASQAGAGYTAGTGPRLLDLREEGFGTVLPLICYEAIFPGDLVVPERPDWMLQVTNDAWFGTLTGPWQHFELTRLRAIEQGLPLLRAANTGISAVIDARGRVTQQADGSAGLLGLGVQGVIDAEIPGALAATPYSRISGFAREWPLVALLLAGLLLTGFLHARRKGVYRLSA